MVIILFYEKVRYHSNTAAYTSNRKSVAAIMHCRLVYEILLAFHKITFILMY